MNPRTSRSRWLIAILAGLAVLLAACGSSSDSGSDTTTTKAADSTTTTVDTAQYADLSGTINGAGSSFQDTFNQAVISEFKKVAPGATVNYQKSGSSDGKKQLAAGTVDFAGTDSLIKDDEKSSFNGTVLYFPTVAAPITVSFNVSGVTELDLSAETLSKIFQAEITTWDDPAIASDNPKVDLPSTKITVVHRSDGSGTTSNFTKYLSDAAADSWKLGSGDTVAWPDTTQGAEKNSGVATVIQQTDGAIGYVDLADAAKANLNVAAIKNKDGKYVAPTPEGASAALAGAEINDDLTYNPLNASGAEAYPITSPTWIIVMQNQTDATKTATLKGFLNYALTAGQEQAPDILYAPLPKDLAQKAIAQIDQIQG